MIRYYLYIINFVTKNFTTNSRGVTLAEAVLAAAVMVFVMSGILGFFIHCSLLNEGNCNSSVAMDHAQYIMEEIRDTTFSQIQSNINNGIWDLNATVLANAPYNLVVLNNEFIDTEVFQAGDPLGFSVTVIWNDRKQRARNIAFRTLLTDYQ